MNNYIVGVDVGGTKIAYGLFDEGRSLIDALRVPSDPGLAPEKFADGIIEAAGILIQKHGITLAELKGVGLCLPSFIDYNTQTVISTANLPLLKDFAVCGYISGALGVPVRLDNDSNAAALAEYRYGAGKGARNMLYCAIGTGLGLGIILDGRVFRGDNGRAGESGHMMLCPGGGDFESHISGGSIAERISGRLREGEESLLTELCGGNPGAIDAACLLAAYRRGDALAAREIEHMARYLGLWAYNLYMTFNINLYVFGGGLTNLGDALLGRAREVMASFGRGAAEAEFRVAGLGDDFGIIGAAELFAEK